MIDMTREDHYYIHLLTGLDFANIMERMKRKRGQKSLRYYAKKMANRNNSETYKSEKEEPKPKFVRRNK